MPTDEKNAPDLEGVTGLTDLVQYQAGAVVSRTLIRKPAGTVTAFAFDAGDDFANDRRLAQAPNMRVGVLRHSAEILPILSEQPSWMFKYPSAFSHRRAWDAAAKAGGGTVREHYGFLVRIPRTGSDAPGVDYCACRRDPGG